MDWMSLDLFNYNINTKSAIYYYYSSPQYIAVSAMPIRMSDSEVMEYELGKTAGIGSNSEITNETLQKILSGVENGSSESIYFYALLKMYGLSLSKNTAIAAQNFERAANLGHIEATTAYGMMLMHGEGVDKDYSLAQSYFRRAVAMKDVNAHWLLGKLLMEGKGANADYTESMKLFQFAANEEHNIPQAQHLLAVMYEYGLGSEQDLDKVPINKLSSYVYIYYY